MIKKIAIKNYALIDSLEINFSKGMTIITGETGSGKSILLGALSLLLGNRADSLSLLYKDKKCVIEGDFNLKDYRLQNFFAKYDLDEEQITNIRREISPEGKSRSFINDTPVNLNTLKELGLNLIEIHSQHETLTLNDSGFQMLVVDNYAKNASLISDFKAHFQEYKSNVERLAVLKEKEKKSKIDAGYFQFQFNEIFEAALKEEEQELLEQEIELLNNSESIKSNLIQAGNMLDGEGKNILTSLSNVASFIQGITTVFPPSIEISQRIKSCQVEIKDIASEIASLERKVIFDPDRISLINERLDTIYRLQQKHRVNSIAELLTILNDLEKQLSEINSLDLDIESLEKSIAFGKNKLQELGVAIRKTRVNAIPIIENSICNMLVELGMKHAQLRIELLELAPAQFKPNGVDAIRFLFSANKGIPFRELNKVASGGELSRLMLCIKSLLAKHTGLPTIIFDEIDAGISGEIAHKVGKILKELSGERQVIAITHLPQMAGKGDDHLFVYKETHSKVTTTHIKRLNKSERVEEIAKMLSGDLPSKAAIANAKELLDV